METANHFWRALEAFAAQLEQCAGNKEERWREIVNSYPHCQSLGIAADVRQLQDVAGELTDIGRLIRGNGHWDV
jgi:hypothetical protein